MYNLKQTPFIVLMLSLFLFVGCTSEEVSEGLNEVNKEDNPIAKRVDFPDVNTFLKTKYPDGYSLANERSFRENDNTFIVKDVFEDGVKEASGFVNLTNGDFTQYLELNRTRDLFVIDDFVDDELYEFDANGEENQRLFCKGFFIRF